MKSLSLPDTNAIVELLEELEEHISSMESLQEDLAAAVEYYADDYDDVLAQAEIFLDEAGRDREVNRMLLGELNEARRELLRLEDCLHENGITPDGECFIYHGRIDPGLCIQDLDSPFYHESPDDHYKDLLRIQYESLRVFEAETPMTTVERDALRSHVILDTGLQGDNHHEWTAFLKGFRSRSKAGR
ncbi:MAG: hypothetical protein Q4D71_13770 [Oscillospiraceae bacterium]|nr:hypothetical protein [Oscillospiraceae bacterium]